MSRYQGWEQPNEPGLNAAPYSGEHAEHYRYCPGCNPVMGHAAFVFAYIVAAISGAIVAALAMAVAVWAGWIG